MAEGFVVSYGTQPDKAGHTDGLGRRRPVVDLAKRWRFAMQRRVAILAALLALASFVLLGVTRFNPENKMVEARQDQHLTLLKRTFALMLRTWANLPRSGARASGDVRADSGPAGAKALREEADGGSGRRPMLSDVFTAPLDVASGLVDQVLKDRPWKEAFGSAAGEATEHGKGIVRVNGRGQERDGDITKLTANAVDHGDVVTHVSGRYQPSSGMVSAFKTRGVVQANGKVWTTPALDVHGQRVADGGSVVDVQAGPLYKVAGGLQTSSFRATQAPSGFGVWSAPAGWQDGSADKQMSITVGTQCGVSPGYPCEQDASARLNLEVYCPPYRAPDHGSVWYKGKEYRDATLNANITNRKVWKVGGKALPIAQYGDIPAGHQVRIACDVHYCLSDEGAEMPFCLMTGEWELGKTCEPIVCAPYVPPPHGVVVPAGPVRAGEEVTIYCEEGFDEYYGADETVSDAKRAGATKVSLARTDPWYDFSRWFAGANQGQRGNLISMEAGPMTALTTVQALRGKHLGFRAEEQDKTTAVKRSLVRVQRKLKALAKERKMLQGRLSLSQGITRMSAADVDKMVQSFVDGGTTPASSAAAQREQTTGGNGWQLLQHDDESRRSASRRLLWGGLAEQDDGKASAKSEQEIERLRKNPVCLDSSHSSPRACGKHACCGHFEPGIYCKRRPGPVVRLPSPPPLPGAPPPVPRGGRIAPPRGRYIVPLVCPSYIAPDHGSVWFRGQEFRIATNAGIPATESVYITCHRHYKLSEIGSVRPQCLPNGQWELGKTCEPIYCADYGNLQYGTVSTHDYVRAGTRIKLTCHPWYNPAGIEHGASCEPMCLDDGTFEKGCLCVPRPCPIGGGDCPDASAVAAEGIEPQVSRRSVRDWEQELQRPMSSDYNPNVFDQEPRPWTLDTPLDRYDTLLRPVDSRRTNYRDTTRSWIKWSPDPSSYDDGPGLWRAREGRVGAGGDRGFVEDEGTRYGGEPLGGSQTGNRRPGAEGAGGSEPGGMGSWPNAPSGDRSDWDEHDD